MKYFQDGDQLCITRDDFVDLQESPAVFIPIDGDVARQILSGGILSISICDLRQLQDELSFDFNRLINLHLRNSERMASNENHHN